MELLAPTIAFVIGVTAGIATAWFVLSPRVKDLRRRVEELRQNEANRFAELETLRKDLMPAKERAAELEARLESERKAAEEKLALLYEARDKLGDAFKALSAEALKSNNESFLALARERLEKLQEIARGDLEKRELAIDQMVKPVHESLHKFDAKLQQLELARTRAYTALEEQVRGLHATENELRVETAKLGKAFHAPGVKGRWGEIQLRRVVEMAGMVNYCDFEEQPSTEAEEGRLRPDLVVRLPGGKQIVVDAKAPLQAYLESLEAESEEQRQAKLAEHAKQVRAHLVALGKKTYWEQFRSGPDFVVLFLPGENLFSAALMQDPALIEAGTQERVIIATPTTLIALLWVVAYGWRQKTIAENAREISDLGRELYKRIVDVSASLEKLGRRLDDAVEAYNKVIGSLETRVLVSARRFRDLEAAPVGVELEELPPVDRVSRALQAPELTSASPGEERSFAARSRDEEEELEPAPQQHESHRDDLELTELLLSLVPEDGSSIGNKSLAELFSEEAGVRLTRTVTEDDYRRCRDFLIAQGKLCRGRGRGGSVFRSTEAAAEPPPAAP